MKTLRAFAAVGSLLSLAGAPAYATVLDGQTVRLTYEFPNVGTVLDTRDVVVGPGVEAPNFLASDPRTNVDFSDTNIYITYNSTATWTSVAFNGFHVFDLFGTIPAFLSVTINGATTLAGLDASRITFDADNIFVNWQGLSFNNETIVSLDVAAVPEPPTLLLVGGGILGLAARRRRAS